MIYKDLYFEYIKGSKKSNVKFVLLHGWGHSLENLRPISDLLNEYDCYLIDLLGFGKSKVPNSPLFLSDYTLLITDFIKNTFSSDDEVYLIGHSFGGRISIQLASQNPELLKGIFIIAGAGLKKRKKIKDRIIIWSAKLLRKLYNILNIDIMKSYFYRIYYNKYASQDYKNANPIMREILKNTVSQDLSNIAKMVKIKTILIYGEKDITTPPLFGKKYHKFIKNSQLYILSTFDHNSILTSGKYQVLSIILDNIKD